MHNILFRYPSFIVAFILSAIVKKETGIDGYREFSIAVSGIPFLWGTYTRYYFYNATLRSVGKNITFMYGCIIEGRDCEIGDNVYIGPYSHIYNNTKIGNDVMIGPHVSILDGRNHHGFKESGIPMRLQTGTSKCVSIGNNVWIGINSTITECIADNCIIGACSLVLNATNKNEVVAGHPAKVIKQL